jgi:hypothetical protein
MHPLNRPPLAILLAPVLALAAHAAAPAVQGDAGCSKPGMDVVPGTHPYGPVKPGDGKVDWIDVRSDVPLDFEFSLAGLDHGASVLVAGNYLTLGLFHTSPGEVPLLLNPCATLELPTSAKSIVVPSATLSASAKVAMPGPVGAFSDVWFQTASVDLASPKLDLAMSDLARVRFHQGPLTPDPTTDKEYGCYYWGYYTWSLGDGVGSVQGRVYWPSLCDDGTQAPPKPLPLVVIVHGDGHSYTDYTYLAKHLALNGFIVASIDGGQGKSNVERAKRVRTYLSYLTNNWTYKNYVQNNIALLGHSRGGEGVLTAARKLNADWGYDYDINAVICLAPTDSDEDGGTEGLESLSGVHSPALLVVYGSMDEDVAGYCTAGTAPDCGAFPVKPQATGFSIYDRAGGEGSTEGVFSFASNVTKSMLFVEGADHNRWREGCVEPPPFVMHKPIGCAEHHDVLKAYANAFLRWRLAGQADYEPYFTGEWTPSTVAGHDVRLTKQFSPGAGRRVIDNFESGPWNDATLGTITNDPQVTVVKKGSLFDHGNFTAPHDTDGMVLRWSTTPFLIEPWIRWSIPTGSGFFTSPYRDFTGFGALSLRAGLMDDAPLNPDGAPTGFFVRMRDGAGAWSPKVWVDAFSDLAYPHQAVIVSPLGKIKSTAKSSLRTARIPLAYFSGIDLADVRDVDLVFGDDAHTKGEILLDSLELVP